MPEATAPPPGGPNEIQIAPEILSKMLDDMKVEVSLDTLSQKDNDFFQSLLAYYTDRGRLTPKQQWYFRKMYLNYFGEMPV